MDKKTTIIVGIVLLLVVAVFVWCQRKANRQISKGGRSTMQGHQRNGKGGSIGIVEPHTFREHDFICPCMPESAENTP